MEVPRLGAESELQLSAYTTATAMLYPSNICDLYHSLKQCQILNPLSKARDRAYILMDTSRIHNLLSHRFRFLFLKPKVLIFKEREHKKEVQGLEEHKYEHVRKPAHYFFFFLAAPVACLSSQARDRTWATAVQCWILTPLSHQGTPTNSLLCLLSITEDDLDCLLGIFSPRVSFSAFAARRPASS